jgi:hypothetical protein
VADIMTPGEKLVTVPEGTTWTRESADAPHRLERVLVVNDRTSCAVSLP